MEFQFFWGHRLSNRFPQIFYQIQYMKKGKHFILDGYNFFRNNSGLKSIEYNKAIHKKMEFSIRDFFSKYDQILRKLRIWSHLLNKFLMGNFIFCAMKVSNKGSNFIWYLKFQYFKYFKAFTGIISIKQ